MKVVIKNEVAKELNNFWNHIHFHPTDAIEDSWGKKLIDRFSRDNIAKTVRLYTMFEDIVYLDDQGNLAYDFRANDLRLDYMINKGFNVVLCYNFMPECIASDKKSKSCMSHNSTRYKGKLINTSAPTDYSLWEEVCYEYTKHIVSRYGEEVVSSWYLQCFNEPDTKPFFLSNVPADQEGLELRIKEYCKLYHSFVDGIRRVSTKLCLGGPALAQNLLFLEKLFEYINENDLQYDFVSLHNYSALSPNAYQNNLLPMSYSRHINIMKEYVEVIRKHNMQDKKIVLDEWGAVFSGFCNIEKFPKLIFRENEMFSTYFVKLIDAYIKEGINIDKMLICLSGQHEMEKEFTGFRGFFTLSSIPKPIYNAYILASKLGDKLLKSSGDINDALSVIPSKTAQGLAILIAYGKEPFEEELGEIELILNTSEFVNLSNAKVTYLDKFNANGYSKFVEMGSPEELTDEDVLAIKESAKLTSKTQKIDGEIKLKASNNSVILVEIF